jgi:hypothetical protein
VDPKYTVRLHGLVTNSSGQRIAGAKVSLWWTRWYPPGKEGRPMMASSNVQETYTTSENGLFVFRGLWPEDSYNVVVEARGHNKGESSQMTGKLGETHDLGKIVLINTDAYLAGRVVGSEGTSDRWRGVFNRGDAPDRSRSPPTRKAGSGSRDASGTRFVFVRRRIPIHRGQEPGQHRWHGHHAAQGHGERHRRGSRSRPQAAGACLRQAGPDSHPGSTVRHRGQQRAFSCIRAMAEIDPTRHAVVGREGPSRYDDRAIRRGPQLAETDAEGKRSVC